MQLMLVWRNAPFYGCANGHKTGGEIMRVCVLAMAMAALSLTGTAQAQSTPPKTFNCGELPRPGTEPKIAPIFRSSADLANSDFDCLAWQDFIFVNWPASRTERGVPDSNAPFDAPRRPTVWESYKTIN